MDAIPDLSELEASANPTGPKSAGRRQRVEIITRTERRRRWTPEQKREIVAESYAPEVTPTEVARRHDISTGQLYTWRHELLGRQAPVVSRAMPQFAEVTLTTPSASAAPGTTPRSSHTGGDIEIILPGNVIVRVDAPVDEAALGRVLGVLRRR
jgi:transposase